MPTARRTGAARRRRTTKSVGRAPGKRAGGPRSKGLACPDCDFVARHAMGLGRHRSAKHGVVSQRRARREASGGWLTRREAARRAGVHYNTIRHWESGGRLRKSRRHGTRGTLVNAFDLERLMSSGGASSPAAGPVDDGRIRALEQRFNDLIEGLERLVSSARRSRRGRPASRGNVRAGRKRT